MEKSGKIYLSPDELAELKAGRLPERIANEWGLSLDEALAMVRNGCYELQ